MVADTRDALRPSIYGMLHGSVNRCMRLRQSLHNRKLLTPGQSGSRGKPPTHPHLEFQTSREYLICSYYFTSIGQQSVGITATIYAIEQLDKSRPMWSIWNSSNYRHFFNSTSCFTQLRAAFCVSSSGCCRPLVSPSACLNHGRETRHDAQNCVQCLVALIG
jgi:hypothetical protein